MEDLSLLASATKYKDLIGNGLDLAGFILIIPVLVKRIDFSSLLIWLYGTSIVPFSVIVVLVLPATGLYYHWGGSITVVRWFYFIAGVCIISFRLIMSVADWIGDWVSRKAFALGIITFFVARIFAVAISWHELALAKK